MAKSLVRWANGEAVAAPGSKLTQVAVVGMRAYIIAGGPIPPEPGDDQGVAEGVWYTSCTSLSPEPAPGSGPPRAAAAIPGCHSRYPYL